MKKQIAVITLLALVLTGCAEGSAKATENEATLTGSAVEQIASDPQAGETPQGAPSQPPSGTAAQPASGADGTPPAVRGDAPQGKRIRGQIQTVLGNEVTLALAEEPKRPEGAADGTQRPKAAAGDPMGGPPGGGNRNAAVKLTGETLKLQIPVGVPIVSRGQNGETALQLSDLTVGSIMTVEYDTDGTTIVQVNLMAGGVQ